MIGLFYKVSNECSKITTKKYSTSFYSAINLLHKNLREPIYNIYGFVRFADEIVDTFHSYDKRILLDEFKAETFAAIERGISLNPILNSFQQIVNKYKINKDLIESFFKSMYLDLEKKQYDYAAYNDYIYGSAETVGLMCLHVFCEGSAEKYNHLKPYARRLGAAFQKVNFLRDINADYTQLNRTYFPDCDFSRFTQPNKLVIEESIKKDFDYAYEGIAQLPLKARFGVYVAYKYYLSLFNKIKRTHPQKILETRIRITDYNKFFILAKATISSRMNLL